ncbi:MAG TPA: glycosyltransferase family 39 protein [Candidatus Paceibacterota bacterium]
MSREHRWSIATLVGILVLIVLFALFLGPNILGDTPSYIQALHVMSGGTPAADFIPNRLLTTFGALETVRLLGAVFGGTYQGWFFLNLILYVATVYTMYALIRRVTGSAAAAHLGALFLAGNYGFLTFGPNFLMDIGGWSFYIFSLYFVWRYAESKSPQWIIWAAACIGIGGLIKEYAFLGGAAVAAYLIVEAVRQKRAKPIGLLVGAGIISLIPVGLLYIYIYYRFGYTYLDWLGFNAAYYTYHSRVLEYIKALGSLYNLSAIFVICGAVVIIRQWHSLSAEVRTFLIAFLVSFLPVFFWPAITQRILTITVPFSVLVAAFFFKRYEAHAWIFKIVLVVYVLATFCMDSYLLKAINVPF